MDKDGQARKPQLSFDLGLPKRRCSAASRPVFAQALHVWALHVWPLLSFASRPSSLAHLHGFEYWPGSLVCVM